MHGIGSLAASAVPPALRAIGEALGLAIALSVLAGTCLRAARTANTTTSKSRGVELPPNETDASADRSTWAMASIAALLCAPHLFVYDLVLLWVPAALLVERGLARRDRLALAALFALTWTAPLRAILAARLHWPATLLGASWTALPMWVLWQTAGRLQRQASAVPGGATVQP
jgi:hypothetical protein